MKTRPNREMKNLLMELKRADDLMEKEQWAQARDILRRGRATAREQGLPYGLIAWRLCICLDNLGDVEDALRAAVEAIDHDPLAHPFRNSFHIVAHRLRGMIAAAEIGDPAVPRQYALLVENDAAEDDTHVAMARHLFHAGEAAQAARLLDAVTTLSPTCAPAWRLRAEVARSLDDEDAATRCDFEAMASENAVNCAVEVGTRP